MFCYLDSNNISYSTLLMIVIDVLLGIPYLLQTPRSLVEYLKSVMSSYVNSGPTLGGNSFFYPPSLMVLSCVMISSCFVLMFSSQAYLNVTLGFTLTSVGFIFNKHWFGLKKIVSKFKARKSNSKSLNISSKSFNRSTHKQRLAHSKHPFPSSNSLA